MPFPNLKNNITIDQRSMAAIQGVETNEASRFIDHTLATPWETLVSDIEVGLRSLNRVEAVNKVDIYYYGLTYRLEKRRSVNSKKTEQKSKDVPRDYLWLLTAFNINWFMILSHATQSNDYHASYRPTILSAFITAVKNFGQAHGLNIPTFFTYSYVTDISRARDLVGFQLLTNAPTTRSAAQSTDLTNIKTSWCRFESHICADLRQRSELCYFDHLRRVFQTQLRNLQLAGKNGDAFFVETDFAYRYNSGDIYGCIAEGRAKAHNSSLISPTRGATNTEHNIRNNKPGLFSPEFVSAISALIPGEDVTLTLLTQLSVDLVYRTQPHHSIIDNAQFTTFVPSKQPPHCWSVNTTFTQYPLAQAHSLLTCTHPLPGGTGTHGSGSGAATNPFYTAFLQLAPGATLSTSWMSLCVRKLLAFYLLSVYCTKNKINIETISAEPAATQGMLSKAILDRILEVLSDESKEVFYAVCKHQIDPRAMPVAVAPAGASGAGAADGKAGGFVPGSVGKSASADAGDRSPIRQRGGDRTSSPIPTGSTAPTGTTTPVPALASVAANLFGSDDWNSRSDRHSGVVELLFSSKSVFSPTATGSSGRRAWSTGSGQERSFSGFGVSGLVPVGDGVRSISRASERTVSSEGYRWGAAPLEASPYTSVGLWFGMFAILCATASIDAHDMATIWSKSMRRAHIATEDEQTLPTFAAPSRRDTNRSAPPPPPPPQASTTASLPKAAGPAGTAPSARESPSTVTQEIPICSRTLWTDALDRFQDRDLSERLYVPLAWPDLQESLVVQKLQLLQFCIAMCEESPIYRFPEDTVTLTVPPGWGANMSTANSTDAVKAETDACTPRTIVVTQPALFRRLPLTEDVIQMNQYLARKVNAKASRSNRDHPTLKVQLQFPSILSDMKAFKAANPTLDVFAFCLWYGFDPYCNVSSAGNGGSTITEPPAPAASDEKPAESVGALSTDGDDSPATPHSPPQETVPATTSPSPVRADSPLPSGAGRVPMLLEEVQKAWNSCEGVPCEQQGKPLFQYEKESEKALAYLESVSAVQLAAEMLCAGMRFLFGVTAAYLEPWLTETSTTTNSGDDRCAQGQKGHHSPTSCNETTASAVASLAALKAALRSDVAVLVEQIELAAEHLRPSLSTDAAPTAASATSVTSISEAGLQVSVAACILVDSVAGLLQKLESMLVKMQTMEALLTSSKQYSAEHLVHALARRDQCTAETDAEMSILYELAKNLRNYKEQVHDWHSKDGRELGQPTRKTFACKLEQPRGTRTSDPVNVSVSSSAGTSVGVSVSSGSAAGASSSNGNGGSGPERPLTASSTLLEIFQMEATVEGHDLLRLALRVPEY